MVGSIKRRLKESEYLSFLVYKDNFDTTTFEFVFKKG
jgi:hypothetical protein